MDSPILRFVICTIMIIVMVIVTYYYRKHVVKPMKPVSGGFKAGIMDDVAGGHMEGSDLVLARSLGGGRYETIPLEIGDTDNIVPGSFWIVYQPIDMRGQRVGTTVMTIDAVPREVALRICSSTKLTGSMSVYTSRQEDAHGLMSEALEGKDPVEYSYSFSVLSVDASNYRASRGAVVPGPMCLFGTIMDPDGEDEETIQRRMDATVGFHQGDDPDTLNLAVDLGGGSWRMASSRDDTSFEEGKFYIHIMVDPSLFGKEGSEASIAISIDPIPKDLAVMICADQSRAGIMSVYTPSRADASNLMEESLGAKPLEVKGSDDPWSSNPSYLTHARRSNRARKVIYGRMAIEGVQDPDC